MIDPVLAPAIVLHAVYADTESAEEQIRRRAAEGPTRISAAISVGGRTFDIAVRTDRSSRLRDAIVMLTGDAKQPYIVLSWK